MKALSNWDVCWAFVMVWSLVFLLWQLFVEDRWEKAMAHDSKLDTNPDLWPERAPGLAQEQALIDSNRKDARIAELEKAVTEIRRHVRPLLAHTAENFKAFYIGTQIERLAEDAMVGIETHVKEWEIMEDKRTLK